jgi:hypothetical protein
MYNSSFARLENAMVEVGMLKRRGQEPNPLRVRLWRWNGVVYAPFYIIQSTERDELMIQSQFRVRTAVHQSKRKVITSTIVHKTLEETLNSVHLQSGRVVRSEEGDSQVNSVESRKKWGIDSRRSRGRFLYRHLNAPRNINQTGYR